MKKTDLYLSTTARDAFAAAKKWGLGIEIADFCTAWNMDDRFAETDAKLQEGLDGIQKRLLHAPFNELFPCAIDPKARALAAERYGQALTLAQAYGAEKVIVHGGYHPNVYYSVWYVEQSALFWREFLQSTDFSGQIVLENVLEETPELLLDIVKAADDPRLRLCLDVGHAHTYSSVPVLQWLNCWGPYISHFHIHDNDGSWDAHCPPGQGTVPMAALLQRAEALCPRATYTLELQEVTPALQTWPQEKGEAQLSI